MKGKKNSVLRNESVASCFHARRGLIAQLC